MHVDRRSLLVTLLLSAFPLLAGSAQTSAQTSPQAGFGTAVPAGAPASVADELTKLARLRDQGVISEAEFQAQKARLLG